MKSKSRKKRTPSRINAYRAPIIAAVITATATIFVGILANGDRILRHMPLPDTALSRHLDRLFGEQKDWFAYPENVTAIGIHRLPARFVVNDPLKFVKNDQDSTPPGDTNYCNCGSHAELMHPLTKKDIPRWQRRALEEWHEEKKRSCGTITGKTIDSIFGNTRWRVIPEYSFGVTGTFDRDVSLSFPITSIDANNLKHGVGMDPIKAGVNATVWVAGSIDTTAK